MSGEKTREVAPGDDPYQVLQVEPDADDGQIRAAYLRQVSAHPPDRSPEQFERIRDAYELLRDPVRRARWRLLTADLGMPLVDLLRGDRSQRRRVGAGLWLSYLARCPALTRVERDSDDTGEDR